MYLQNELKYIAKRLFDEKICLQPLDERALEKIYRYTGMTQTGGDLMRRLSDIEINCDEITREADQAAVTVKETVKYCKELFKSLIDEWSEKGLTSNFSFSVSKADLSVMYRDYSIMAEDLSVKIKSLSNACDLLAETSVQTKACAASFLKVYNETRLAYYAAALNKDTENMLSCRAILLQAHDSSSESNRNAAKYLSVAKSGNVALSVINSVLSETTDFFVLLPSVKQIKTNVPVNKFINGIETLKNISTSIKI